MAATQTIGVIYSEGTPPAQISISWEITYDADNTIITYTVYGEGKNYGYVTSTYTGSFDIKFNNDDVPAKTVNIYGTGDSMDTQTKLFSGSYKTTEKVTGFTIEGLCNIRCYDRLMGSTTNYSSNISSGDISIPLHFKYMKAVPSGSIDSADGKITFNWKLSFYNPNIKESHFSYTAYSNLDTSATFYADVRVESVNENGEYIYGDNKKYLPYGASECSTVHNFYFGQGASVKCEPYSQIGSGVFKLCTYGEAEISGGFYDMSGFNIHMHSEVNSGADIYTGRTAKVDFSPRPAEFIRATDGTVNLSQSVTMGIMYSLSYVTLSYEFGTLTGTAIQRIPAGGNYFEVRESWKVPEAFYSQMLDTKSKKCTLIAKTYLLDGTYIGEETVEITIYCNEKECLPTLTAYVGDVDEKTSALTGNTDTLIKFASDASVFASVDTKFGATLKSVEISNGGKKIYSQHGIIEDVESGDFTFIVVDSRGYTVTAYVTKEMIEYVKPTCNLKANALVDNTMIIDIFGNYFDGSFGASPNTIKLEYKYSSKEGLSTDWIEADSSKIVTDDSTYKCHFVIDNDLNYRDTYYVIARITDVFTTIESNEAITTACPIMDWSGYDVNFNVPILYSDGGTQYNITEMVIEMYNAFKNGT